MGVLADLARQLRYAPREALVRDIERVEALAGEVDPSGRYPSDWVVFRLTGYRPAEGPAEVVGGRELLGELSSFAEHLSEAARLGMEEEVSRGAVKAGALMKKWGVSRSTLVRMRRSGLVARRARTARRTTGLVFSPAVVERFERGARSRVARAGAFERIGPREARRMIREGERYRRVLGMSTSMAAKRIAERHGRSHEGVRQLLAREWGSSSGKLGERERRAALRAAEWGIGVEAIAKRAGRSVGAVRRALVLARVERLEAALSGEAGSISAGGRGRATAGAEVLSRVEVVTGLGAPAATDWKAFLESARGMAAPDPKAERVRVQAYRALVARARARLAGVDRHHPSVEAVDAVERDLRWAARVKAEVMRPVVKLVIEAVEARLGRRVEGVSPGLAVPLVMGAMEAGAEAVEGVDPTRGGRVAGAVGLAVDRVALSWMRRHAEALGAATTRRAEMILSEGKDVGDWTRSVSSWQWAVEAPARIREAVARNGSEGWARLLARRYGWDGSPPATLKELAREGGTTLPRLTKEAEGAWGTALWASRRG